MLYTVDTNRKIIFGWSPKCGCSHIKQIYWFLQTDNMHNKIHTTEDCNPLPDDIENYTTLIFCRNPYKRLVSGFLEKYGPTGEFRHLWKHSSISFSQFVDEVVRNNWSMIDYHHFTRQTTENFDKKILFSKIIKFYDITNIDYHYIEQLYNKKIPEYLINYRGGHERASQIKKTDIIFDECVCDLNMDEYIDYHIDTKYFYNEEIKQKVFNFYINDFIFFKENGIDYMNSEI
jgi:hypothetical protein